MKKWHFYSILTVVFLVSFRMFSSMFYPAFNSDNAVPVLMVHYFDLPHDWYYWGIDRLGSLIPLLAQFFHRVLNFSALSAESITHYLILLLGFLAFSSFIKSYFYKIIFAIVWFVPPMRLIDVTQFYHGIHYSLIAILCYLFSIIRSDETMRAQFLKHCLYFLIIAISITAVWVSDMAIISVSMLFMVQFYFYWRENGINRKILRKPLLYYTLVGATLGYLFIQYAKSTASARNHYSEISDFSIILKTVQLFFRSLFDFFLFKANEPFTSVYSYLVLFLAGFLIYKYRKLQVKVPRQKLIIFFLMDAMILFSVIMVSYWTYHNFVPRRYFTCTYIAISFVVILLFDSLSLPVRVNNMIRSLLLFTVLLGGIGTVYNLKYVFPKRLTPMVKITSEWQQLGNIGIISEYWNSYMVSCTAPDQIISTPHDKAEVKNYDFVRDLFNQDRIFVNRDMWMDSFPDTLHQFGRTLIIEGTPFIIGDSHACEYKLLSSSQE